MATCVWYSVSFSVLTIGEFVDDLFQVGCIGLMKAIDNFDLSQNVKFSTYAVPMIIGEIRRYLRDNNPIRYPGPSGILPIRHFRFVTA